MRIYIKAPKSYETLKAKVTCPAPGFYNVPSEVGDAWVESGEAFEATEGNLVLAWDGDDNDPLVIDLDSGDVIDDSYSTTAPEEEPLVFDSSDTTDDEQIEED